MTPARSGLLLSLVFLAFAIAFSGALPLWLDEILQLLETRDTSVVQMLTVLPRNPGAAPLGYLVQQTTLRIGGYSVRRARLPMAVFASAAVFLVTLLAFELGIRWPWLAATLFAMFPLTFRYATESRVYSQALLFSLLATLIYVRAAKRPSWGLMLVYGLVLTAAIYTQAFAASVGLAHVLWSLLRREKTLFWMGAVVLAAAVLLFLPWYFWSKDMWAAGIGPNALHFSITFRTPLMLFRELAGAGYWGSGLLLILCVIAILSGMPSPGTQSLLIVMIAVPILAILAADFAFNYFIAARQFIWVLPAVALLAAGAVEKYPRCGLALAAGFCFVGLMQSAKYFTAPHEDFHLAAGELMKQSQQGVCVVFAPKELSRLYEFFEPKVAAAPCDMPRLVLAVTPYTSEKDRTTATAEIMGRGYKKEREEQLGGSSLVFFYR
jgi:4-amino-4-deoxy-L-arabinose transferase-like glycosyltransferase